MKSWAWTVVAAIGFGMMMLAYSSQIRPGPPSPWEHGTIIVGPEDHEALGKLPPGKAISTSLRLLPAEAQVEAMLQSLSLAMPKEVLSLQCQLRPKLIVVDPAEVEIARNRCNRAGFPRSIATKCSPVPERRSATH